MIKLNQRHLPDFLSAYNVITTYKGLSWNPNACHWICIWCYLANIGIICNGEDVSCTDVTHSYHLWLLADPWLFIPCACVDCQTISLGTC